MNQTPALATSSDQHVIDVGINVVADRRFVLSFTNLTYGVKPTCRSEGRAKALLNSITGEARGGEILAIMGASGAGKTTLIDALAGRIAKDSLEGSITLNGKKLDDRLLKSISAYVMQDDLLFPMLTVEETLMFSAEFQLPRALPATKRKARVQAIIKQLGLQSASKTIIGDERHRGVSGGERRRVSIGIGIIHHPVVIFLDEPVSGLDSTSAFVVVKALQRIARCGNVVIMSIHQPSSRILDLLDRLILISCGQTVYHGSLDNLPSYFSDCGYPIPKKIDQIEFVLDLVAELDSTSGTNDLVEFNKSWQMKIVSPLQETESVSSEQSPEELVSRSTTFANQICYETLILVKRSFTNTSRIPQVFGFRLAGVIFTGLVLASLFWKPDETPKGVKERTSFFVFTMSTVYYMCIDALPAILQERHIFMRETSYNAYRTSSYVLSNAILSLPPHLILSIVYAAITYFAVGLSGGISGFLFFLLTIFAAFWAGSSFITFISAITSHDMVAFTVAIGHLGYFLLFSGFFINRQRIPTSWIWFHYLSLVKYPYQAAVQNEFGYGNTCFARGVEIFEDTIMGSMPERVKEKALGSISEAMGLTIMKSSCMTTGLDIMKEEGVMDLSKWDCLLVTVAFGFFFRVLFYFALLLGSKNKRK